MDENKKEKRVTLLSILATGPACALLGFSLGNQWGDFYGGVIGMVLGYGYGVYLHKWLHGKFDKKSD